MKFIHTADWHLGRQFHNVSLLEDQLHVLNQIVAYLEQEQVDALIIAGDIYDRSVPPAAAIEALDGFANRVCSEMNIPIIMIPGNHDGAARLRFGARQFQAAGLYILGDLEAIETPVIVKDVAFYGIPYNDPETIRNLFNQEISTHNQAHQYLVKKINRAKNESQRSVLISHCFLDGAAASESERPLAVGGVDRVDFEPIEEFDYVALGHLHGPQYRGREHIRYSGSILKYSFSEERQRKGVTLVEIDETGLKSFESLPLKPLRDMRTLTGEMQDLVDSGKVDPGKDDYLLVRLTDRHAILDPMGKLRDVYPNVLHLEKPGMLETGSQQADSKILKQGELEMFRDFFLQITGQELSHEQDQTIQSILNELKQLEAQK